LKFVPPRDPFKTDDPPEGGSTVEGGEGAASAGEI
jgi:hypothetical protein